MRTPTQCRVLRYISPLQSQAERERLTSGIRKQAERERELPVTGANTQPMRLQSA